MGFWRLTSFFFAGFAATAFYRLQEQRKEIEAANAVLAQSLADLEAETRLLNHTASSATSQLQTQVQQFELESVKRRQLLAKKMAIAGSIANNA